MTQKEIKDLTIFLGEDDAFISKYLKNGKISRLRREINETELFNMAIWFVKSRCKKYNANDFTLNVNGVPKYKFEMLNGVDVDVSNDLNNVK